MSSAQHEAHTAQHVYTSTGKDVLSFAASTSAVFPLTPHSTQHAAVKVYTALRVHVNGVVLEEL